MQGLPIEKIVFGKTDAFKELQACGQDYFVNSFVSNPKYHIDEFLNGQRYYICGKKGTGKSAFLRYLEYEFSKKTNNLVFSIRFKSEFDQIDKDSFDNIAIKTTNPLEEPKFDANHLTDQTTYVYVWKTFLINQIVARSNIEGRSVFEDDDSFRTMISLLKCIYGDDNKKYMVMPKIKKGTVELTTSFALSLSASLKIELDFDSKKNRINYQKLIKKICLIFNSLKFSKSPVYVLIDELELSVRNKFQYNKDIALVRDLIIAIDELNSSCLENHFNIHFMASIRSEVVNSVCSAGYELTKPIEDSGVEVNWFQKGGNYTENPLLQIIENKIHASEILNGCPISSNVWSTYFDEKINGEEVRKFILNNSLYRPRDIIRMMLAIHDQHTASTKFSQELFDKAQQEYSRKMWNEITDELRLTYNEDEIDAIFTLLNRITLPFTYETLQKRIDLQKNIYPNIKTFFEKEKLITVLAKLYDLGVIGNTGARMNFIFQGGSQIDPLEQMVIHTPLRNFFSVKYTQH